MDEITWPDLTAPHQKGEWVSKSDLVAYLRCPYAFWLLDTGQIRPWEALGWPEPPRPSAENQPESYFQHYVEIARKWIPALRRSFVFERDRLLFRNDERKILGRPDGVQTAEGALFPVVLKVKGDVSRIDELALAFYWLVLEPYQQVEGLKPLGYVVFADRSVLQKVRLRPKRFDEVLATCEAIREARRRGVIPRICNCPYCKGRPEVEQAAIEAKDLSCILGIGPQRRARLERLGLASYADLLPLDPQSVGRQVGISAATLAGWRAHARSYDEHRPVIFGWDRLELRDMLVLDIEYSWLDLLLPEEHIIWLIGLCPVVGGRRKYEFLWADSPDEERRNILALLDRLERYGKVPIVTWSGRSADFPQLLKAIKRLRIRPSRGVLDARHHVDVLEFMRANVRLPIPKFSLKDVAEYWGIARRSRVADGREANALYAAYRQERRGKQKRRLQRKLQRYCYDDLKCVVEVVGRLGGLA